MRSVKKCFLCGDRFRYKTNKVLGVYLCYKCRNHFNRLKKRVTPICYLSRRELKLLRLYHKHILNRIELIVDKKIEAFYDTYKY